MTKVVIFGNGQQARMNYFYLSHDSSYEVVAFTVDRKYINEDSMGGLPVVPFEEIETIYPPYEYNMSVLVSYRNLNWLRAEKYGQAKAKGYHLVNYISSKATTWPDLIIGDNCFIFENSAICPFVKVGNDVFIGPGSTVGHNSIIKDHCYVGPNAVILGSVTIEPYCFIGANSTIKDGELTIGRESIIGAGALITKGTKEKSVYFGKQAELAAKSSSELRSLLTWQMKVHKPISKPGDEEKNN
jgi:sugar O-acyltransferase (sialic acid O-acetyltransferase NeuD family)